MPARKPGYFLIAVFILALGTGVNAVIFLLMNATLLRGIGGGDPNTLVRLYAKSHSDTQARFSVPDFMYYREQKILQDLAATTLTGVSFESAGSSLGELVSANYFSLLKVQPQRGRAFYESEDYLKEERVVVISDQLWERMFSRHDNAIGKQIVINHDAFRIIGVAPAGFTGTFAGATIDIWTPIGQVNWLGRDAMQDRSRALVQLIGRLKAHDSPGGAQAALTTAAQHLEKVFPGRVPRTGVMLQKATLLHGNLRKGITIFLSLMLAISALVLLAACANLANVALMHATARRREIAIRRALGASAVTLLRQFVAEGLVTSLAGGICGLIAGQWAAGALSRFNPIPTVPLHFNFTVDSRVLIFQFGLCVITGVVLGLIPGMHLLRTNFQGALRDGSGGATTGTGRTRARKAMVVVQIAVTSILLVCAGLFLRSLQNAATLDLGFDDRHTLATDIDLKAGGLNAEQGSEFYRSLLQRMSSIPGVRSVSLANLAPLDIATQRIPVESPSSPNQEIRMSTNTIDAGYFQTLGIPLTAGHDFTLQDSEDGRRVAIINETMARRFWPGSNALGAEVTLMSERRKVAIIGVAKDVKIRTLGEDPEPHLYLPFSQNYQPSMTLLVSADVNPASLLEIVPRQVAAANPAVQAFFTRTLEQHVGFALLPAKLAAWMSVIMCALAFALSMLGIYGSIGYSVALRTREIGIRMALGAASSDVLASELRTGMMLIASGLICGLGISVAAGRLLSGLLYGITPFDPWTLITASVILCVVAVFAIYFPARHATRINPAAALRQ